MGCASSNPLIDSGKNFLKSTKNSAEEFIEEGEHVIEDTAISAKHSVLTGVEHVKDKMHIALGDAEEGIHSVMGKFSDSIHESRLDVNESVANLVNTEEQLLSKISDSATLSETDTVPISEAESLKNDIKEVKEMAFNKVNHITDEMENAAHNLVNETSELEIVDLDALPNDNSTNETVEEAPVKESTPSSSPPPPPEENAQKEERLFRPPTPWEARADAMLELRMKSIEINIFETEPDDEDFSESFQQQSNSTEAATEEVEENIKTERIVNKNEAYETSNNQVISTVVVITEH